MSSLSTVFITICMLIVSICIGATSFLLGFSDISFASILVLASFVGFYVLQFHLFVHNTSNETKLSKQDNQKEIRFLLEQISQLGRQIEFMEKDIVRANQQVHALVNRQLDEEANKRCILEAALVQMEERIEQLTPSTVNFAHTTGRTNEAQLFDNNKVLSTEKDAVLTQTNDRLISATTPTLELAKQVLEAIKADAVHLCLSPIVTLPHRRPKFHQASLQVVIANGQRIDSEEFTKLGFSDEIMALADVKIFQKASEIIPEFRKRTPEAAFFITINRETLRNGSSFSNILEIFETHPKIVDQLIIGVSNNILATLDPLETATLGALRKQNIRFCVTDITTLRLDMDSWSAMGMRFAVIPANLLQDEQNAISSDIALADVPLLLRRYGVEIIVSEIHLETTIVEVLEFDVRYGQGYLFGSPRPVSISSSKQSNAA